VLLSDTVGFIRNLPERLFASFESTLAEVSEATLLLVAVDASDPERAKHLATTESVLSKLGAAAIPRLVVFNKIDRVPEAIDRNALRALSGSYPSVLLSSHDAEAVAALREALLTMVRVDQRRREVFVAYERPDITDAIYRCCRVHRVIASARGTQFVIEGQPHVVDDIAMSARKGGQR
jgi:GTP-binding protein HflX